MSDEIEHLRAERAGDQQRLFHYEAEIERLQSALEGTAARENNLAERTAKAESEIERLRAALSNCRKLREAEYTQREELLAALEVVCNVHDEKIYNPEWISVVRAARAKAEKRS